MAIRAEGAETREELCRLLAGANILLWTAVVQNENGVFAWKFEIPEAVIGSPLARLASTARGGLWNTERMPDLDQMTLRAELALARNAPGYHHEFRILIGDKVHWLRENVAIRPVGAWQWALSGAVVDITPEHEADEALKQSQHQLKAILERADCMVWQARVVEANGAFEWHFNVPDSGLQRRIFGIEHAFLFEGTSGPNAKKLFGDYSVPEQAENDARFIAALRDSIPGYEQEFHLVSPSKTFLVQERVSINPIQEGEWNIVGLVVDITARREAEEAGKASRAQLIELLDKADCILWKARVTVGADEKFLWEFENIPPSRLYRRLFGRDPTPDRYLLWNAAAQPDLEQMGRRSQGALIGGASSYEQEFRTLRDGKVMWVREQVSITPIEPGRWHLVGVATDVTARREAETALATEKERLAVTLRAMDEGVITVDTNGAIQFMNLAAEKLTGCRESGSIGRGIEAILSLGTGVAEARDSALPIRKALEQGIAFDIPQGVELRAGKDRRHLVEGCCAPVRNERSEIIGAVLVFRDVTERQRLKTELQRASKLESIGVLAGGIAHDFNNLLTAIMGNLTLATLDLEEGRNVREYLDEAQAASLRARDLTQQLLTFSKGGDPVRSAVELPGIVEEVAQFALRGSRAKCEFSLQKDLWPADADKGQIGQIVQNLVINAGQAMPSGGIVRICGENETVAEGAATPLEPGDYVHISVADSGVGIAPGDLANIFDPYFTTKKHGSGLGLATVYSIVKKHRGQISVESEIGRGTTFHIRLPASHQRLPGAKAKKEVPAAGLRGRVLLMDDEESIRLLAAQLLKRMGFDVELAKDGAEAVRKFGEAHAAGKGFAAVVMDLTVPGGMGGCEALAGMRAVVPGVKAIVSSGYSSDDVMANYQSYGFSGMVAKPYAVEEFSRVMREVLAPGPGSAPAARPGSAASHGPD